jgi:hypothetical protein
VPSGEESQTSSFDLSLLKVNLTFPPTLPSNMALSGNQFVNSIGSVMALKTTSGEASMTMLFLISRVLLVVLSLVLLTLRGNVIKRGI